MHACSACSRHHCPQLTLVAEKGIKGCAYEVLAFQGGKLLSSCNSKLQVHR